MNRIISIMLSYSLLSAGDVCLKTEKTYADVKVYVVDNRRKADLRVYITDSHFEGNGSDSIWRFAKNGFSCPSVAFTTNKSEADISVHFVSNSYKSGWTLNILTNDKHKLKGVFK